MFGLHSGNVDADIHSNKQIFLGKNPSINSKLKVFEVTVTPFACFAAGHCSIRQSDLRILHVEFLRLQITLCFSLIGLDHRCAHSISLLKWCTHARMRKRRGLKWWQPTLDSNGLPAKFHNIFRMNKVRGQHNSLEWLERSLKDARQGGNRENTYLRFQPSGGLERLRAQRRVTRDTHRQEIRGLENREVKRTVRTFEELENTS